MRGHQDLEGIVFGAVGAAVTALTVPWEPLRVLVGVPLALFLPGYALLAAIFGSHRLGWPIRAVLSTASSIGVLALGTLLLNYLPGGIRGVSWAILLVVVVIVASLVAAQRRGAPVPRRRRASTLRLRRVEAALFGGAIVTAVAAVVLAQATLSANDAVGFTALWMMPSGGRGHGVTVGVASNEQKSASYRLEVGVGGAGTAEERFSLAPGQEVTFRFRIRGPLRGKPRRVFASLYRSAAPRSLYRRVTTWVPGATEVE